MEHTTPIATPAQRQAIHRNQQQRLRNQAEALLRAVEDLDPPKTHKDAEQAARTLLAVGKVLDAVYDLTAEDERIMCAANRAPEPEAEQAALSAWTAVLNRSLNSLAAARRTNRDRANDPSVAAYRAFTPGAP